MKDLSVPLPTQYGEDSKKQVFDPKSGYIEKEYAAGIRPHTSKLRIYLADLVHNYVGRGPFMMPINLGYITAYAQKFFRNEVNISLFKFADELMDAINERAPDILGLSNYYWAQDLSAKILTYAKRKNPKTLTVMGGPNIHDNPAGIKQFLSARPDLDIHVMHQGEPAFANILRICLSKSFEPRTVKQSAIDGCAFLEPDSGGLVLGAEEPRIPNLDIIPSPYLTGVLDKYFETSMIPSIETNRGCPYKCTFCAWGNATLQKLNVFSIERIKEELHYIARKSKKSDFLNICDANFGIFSDRDLEFAKTIRELHDRTGYPRKVISAWAKNKTPSTLAIAETLGDLCSVTISFQSMDPTTLKIVKRSNMKLDHFEAMEDYFARKGVPTHTELILGMPGETADSHIKALRTLVDKKCPHIIAYNCYLMGGTEMDLPEEKSKYRLKSKFRLLDNAYGKYGDFISIEQQEIILGTFSMTEEEILAFRPVHWLIHFMWNLKYYYELLRFVQCVGVNPIDFIVGMIERSRQGNKDVVNLFNEFDELAGSEYFPTREALVGYYSQDKNFEHIAKGGFGKLNYVFTFRVLLEVREAFDDFLKGLMLEFVKDRATAFTQEHRAIYLDLVDFHRASGVDFKAFPGIERRRIFRSRFDVLRWKAENFGSDVLAYYDGSLHDVQLVLPADQVRALVKLIDTYGGCTNLNFTLRKMSEYMRWSDLLYSVEKQRSGKGGGIDYTEAAGITVQQER